MNLEKIWSQYRSSLKSFLLSRLSDRDEVEDLLQTILIKVYEKQDTIKSDSSIKSWLLQVANNTIVDFYRKQGRIPKIDTNDLWYSESDPDAQSELAQCVEPFIAGLPTDTANLLTAIDIEGESQKEYAERLGISYSTLKSRVQKGRGQLRDLFTNCCHLSLGQHGYIIDFDQKSGNCKDC